MVIFSLAPDQTIAQMRSNGARGGVSRYESRLDKLRPRGHNYILPTCISLLGIIAFIDSISLIELCLILFDICDVVFV